MFSFSLICESIAAQFLTFVPHEEQTLAEKDSLRATNIFSELIHPLLKSPNCVLRQQPHILQLSEALVSFGFLPLREATGFVDVVPHPLIFDPPLYILHFTIDIIFHRETTLKSALEITGYSVKIRSQVPTTTRAILPRNQSASVSNSQRGWSCEQIFDSSTTFLNPLDRRWKGQNELVVWKTGSRFFSLASHALRACEARALRVCKTLTPRFTDFLSDFEKKTDCFAV